MSDLLELRYVPISQVELFDNNAKLHNLDQIIESIAKYGFKSACKWEGTLNNRRGGVVAGNGRVEALRVMEKRGDDCPTGIALSNTGEWCVPVLFGVESSSEVVARAYALDDNNLTLLGGDFAVADLLKLYNQELLTSELEELSKYDEIPVSIGETNLEELLSQLASDKSDEPEPEYGEDDPTVPKGIQIREGVEIGAIFALGRHRIMCGDSTVEANVQELLGERFNNVDIVFSDAPYGMNVVKNKMVGAIFDKSLAKKGSYKPVIGDETGDTAIKCFSLCHKLNGKQFWWGANWYSSFLPSSSCWIIWDKRCDTGIENTFSDAEICWTNLTGVTRIYRQLWNGMIREGEHEKRVHPTQKPVALCEWIFEKYGKLNDLIFDPFLGSAPSIIAAERMEGSRTVFGMELSPEYIEIILQRFSSFTSIPAKRIN